MNEIFTTVTTKIKNRWHVRLMHVDGNIIDEMACDARENIGYICYIMLRWADKMGWPSPMANATRNRQKAQSAPGKIWYRNKLHD